jgi:hypothetical protein
MKVERKEKEEEEDAFALVFQKRSCVFVVQNKTNFSLCDLTIDFCFFHLPVFFVFFVSPSFISSHSCFFCFITPEITFARF